MKNDRGTPVNLSFTHTSTCTHKCTHLRKNRRCKVGLQNTKTNLPGIEERKKTVAPLIRIYHVYPNPNPKFSVITLGETSRRHPDKNMFTRDRILPIARV